MSELLVLGASHHTAALSLRERLALSERQAVAFLGALVATPEIREAVVLSTCNRTEVYVVAREPVEAETALLGMLARHAGIRPTELVDSIYSWRNCDAARHLFRVAAGLDSMVLGEAEVQGQVKRAYEQALGASTTGPLTNKLFRGALASGKRVRTETGIGAGRGSVASVAVDATREALGDLRGRRAVIIGAGETAELTARALHADGLATLFVANRGHARAVALAERFGGESRPLDTLPEELAQADVVIASTASPHTIVRAEVLEGVMAARAGRSLLLLDLAVPRDIDPACADLPGVTLLDVDHLDEQVHRHRVGREAEASRAEAIVEEDIQHFAGWLGTLEVLPTLAALRERADAVVDEVLEANAGRWDALSERDRERVAAVARAVANRLLHEPTARLRALEGDGRHARLQILRELFGLDEAPAADAEHPAEVRTLRASRG